MSSPLTERLALLSRTHGDYPAIATERESLTFSELGDAVARAYKWLSRVTVPTRSCVVLVENREIDDVVLLLAALRSRNPFAVVSAVALQQESVPLPEPSVLLVAPKHTALYSMKHPKVVSKDGWRREAGSVDLVQENAHHATLLIQTSGSSGPSRWVIHDQDSLFRSIRALEDNAQPLSGKPTRWLSVFPLSTIGGLVILLRYIASGDCVILPAQSRVRELSQICAQLEVSGLALFPEAAAAVLRHITLHPASFTSVRIIGSGGSVLDRRVTRELELRLGVLLVNSYGSTELGGPVLIALGAGAAFEALPSVLVRLDDGGHLGAPGELQVQTDVRPRGYWAGTTTRPLEYVDPQGWYSTGDVFVPRGSGLDFSHRLSQGPATSAEVFRAVTLVEEAIGSGCCVALFGNVEPSLEGILLFVEPGGHDGPAIQALADEIVSAVTSVPYRIVILDELPRTSTGKVCLSALRKQFPVAEMVSTVDD